MEQPAICWTSPTLSHWVQFCDLSQTADSSGFPSERLWRKIQWDQRLELNSLLIDFFHFKIRPPFERQKPIWETKSNLIRTLIWLAFAFNFPFTKGPIGPGFVCFVCLFGIVLNNVRLWTRTANFQNWKLFYPLWNRSSRTFGIVRYEKQSPLYLSRGKPLSKFVQSDWASSFIIILALYSMSHILKLPNFETFKLKDQKVSATNEEIWITFY